jgi:hypothetical protein
MAVDKLAVYNHALTLVGQRKLSAVDEDRPSRHDLDAVWDLDATQYILEIVKPKFASKTVTLNSPAAATEHSLSQVHTLPDDYLNIIEVYSDSELDQPISRYIIEGDTLACDFATVYLRYTFDVTDLTLWRPTVLQVLTAYLAQEIAPHISPDEVEKVQQLFLDRVKIARDLDGEKEPGKRATASTRTLTNDWRKIYNDALLIMGLDEITSNDDDSNRRTKLDVALEANLVSDLLEDVGWTFALTSVKIDYDPNSEPEWGYQYVHNKPDDLHRINGLFQDEYMQVPLKAYQDHGSNFFCGLQSIYLEYVSDTFLTDPTQWPTFFARLVAAYMARSAATALKREGADVQNALDEYEMRKREAQSNDAMSSPPRKLATGSWVNARFNRLSDRNRP